MDDEEFVRVMNKLALTAIGEFANSLHQVLRQAVAKEGIDFDDLTFRHGHDEDDKPVTIAYLDKTPILRWSSPVVTTDGASMTFEWRLKKLHEKKHDSQDADKR